MKKILGMGNALTDILLQVEGDALLNKLNLPKGSMQLVDKEKLEQIYGQVDLKTSVMAAGGSASNTINGLSKLGVETGFIGKICDDEIGKFFLHDTLRNGVIPFLEYSQTPSGNCTVLVTPDGERTLCTFLGAATELNTIDMHATTFSEFDIFHVEGYLVQNHELILKAIQMAKEAGLMVSVDLASYNVVEENLEFLQMLIRDYVDIVFANEEEARAFTGKDPKEALIQISAHAEIAVVKVGKEGSYVKNGDKDHQIEAYVANCIDTTGAGDLYATGFLYGLSKGYAHEVCGQIGSYVASKVVEVIGAKMDEVVWDDIRNHIKKLTA